MPHGVMPENFGLLLAASTLLDLVVSAVCLLVLGKLTTRRELERGAQLTLPQLLISILITSAGFYVKWRVLRRFGFNVFGLVHLVYLDLSIVVPLLGLLLLFLHRRARTTDGPKGGFRISRSVHALSLLVLLIVPIAGWSAFVEPWRLVVTETSVPVRSLPAGSDPVSIGILADLQTDECSSYETEAVAQLLQLKPDFILITGDTFQGTDAQFVRHKDELRDLLATLNAPGGVFLITGNTDETLQISELIQGTSIRWLKNEVAQTTVNGRTIAIGGVDFSRTLNGANEVVSRLESTDADLRILMAHLPDVIRALPDDSTIDLTISGHTHGGQVVIPGFGPVITATSVPRRIAAGGLNEMNGNRLFISRGIGHERGQAPRVRFNCRPEIALLIIEPDQSG